LQHPLTIIETTAQTVGSSGPALGQFAKVLKISKPRTAQKSSKSAKLGHDDAEKCVRTAADQNATRKPA
jgi:hypothetical protein